MSTEGGPTTSAPGGVPSPPPPAAREVFADRLEGAVALAALLAGPGSEQGVIGPREIPRLWERHLLNSAAVAEVLPRDASVVDVGSGAGLPGLPLALARPDLTLTLVEPMARRVAWLERLVAELDLPVTVVRGRAEERETRRRLGESDVVTARAVAPLARLVAWTLPLVRPGGLLAALKGARAHEEATRDAAAIRAAGGTDVRVVDCGVAEAPARVVVVHRDGRRRRGPTSDGGARGRKDRGRE